MSTLARTMLARVRKLCLSFPETSERESHGAPTFFVADKRSFLTFVERYYGEGRMAIVCAAPDGAQASLVEAAPERFFLPKYVAKLGWIGMYLDGDPPWAEVESIIESAYATRAPSSPRRPKRKKARSKRAKITRGR
jgi:hypothetical protein